MEQMPSRQPEVKMDVFNMETIQDPVHRSSMQVKVKSMKTVNLTDIEIGDDKAEGLKKHEVQEPEGQIMIEEELRRLPKRGFISGWLKRIGFGCKVEWDGAWHDATIYWVCT